MKNNFFIQLVFLVLMAGSSCKAQQLALTTEGKANYTIVTAGDVKELAAAKILQDNLQKISGASFSISQSAENNSIQVLTADDAKKISSQQLIIPGEEGIVLKTFNKDVYIIGGTGNGVNNAVYEFLEKYLGCRYYTSDAVLIPQNKNPFIPSNINYSYTPVIKYRYVYSWPAFQGEYAGWNKLQNTPGQIKTPPVGLWVHSMFTLVPPQKYFATHPEYFALRNGIRVKTQLNLTNPDVLSIAKQSLDSIIKKNPQATIFSVSQMDNSDYCECDDCKRKARETGSQSGVILDFVNKLAADFPDKIISTLAYNYSRSAPTNITPAKNVNIMFCATGVNRAVPFINDKSQGSVYSDLNAWSKLTNNIFFWDYIVDFRHLYLPFPTYQTLQPNIQFIASNKIIYTFQNGWGFRGSDMTELKTYLISQLLWNPDIDVKATRDEFVKFYYGEAAPYILQYLDALNSYVQTHQINLTTSDAPLDHINDFLSPAQIKLYRQYFNSAKNAVAQNAVYLQRVQNAEQSIRYTILDGMKKLNISADTVNYANVLSDFKNVAATAKVDKIEEGNASLNDFVADQEAYEKNNIVKNLAAGASLTVTNPASYSVKNADNLFDKSLGNKTIDEKWVAFQQQNIELVIDMKKAVNIDSISARFMHNPQLKVNLPEYIKYAVSTNGKSFTDIGVAKNIWAGMGVKEDIKNFVLKTSGNTTARYIKMNIKMVGSANIDSSQSMLCDEIIVQ
ncbi:MAG: DUF4838 domain-containing protein [Parafilimonas sp.]